ncbi:hypothetical protein [Thalassobacillus hwangdonensis]|uniref:Uncharacterized protein n=1 Tax=Thalassobacillus hwangdonensis TaxID=546108 RepID=A0ABW3L2U0_9BACI
MRKILQSTLILLLIMSCCFQPAAFARSNDLDSRVPMTVDEVYQSMGYVEVSDAINTYESKTSYTIALPEKLPFQTEKNFGKAEGDKLTIDFVSDNGKKLFKLTIQPLADTKQEYNFKLEDGSPALLKSNPSPMNVTFLYFQKDKFLYSLSLNYYDKKSRREKLIDTANSMMADNQTFQE